MNYDIEYSRAHLKLTMAAVRKKVSKQDIKAAWTYDYKDGKGNMEFHGPNRFYICGRYSNRYACRAAGWNAYLESIKNGPTINWNHNRGH